jgi:Gram-negative bacterial TonB protein C-terminal
MKNILAISAMAMVMAASGSLLSTAAQQAEAPLPKVLNASIPVYPPSAPFARIQGVVTLRVSTDGTRVVRFDAESGPYVLVQAAKDNIKTWEFQPHKPTTFEVKFQYRLIGYHCEAGCNCHGDQKESVLLQLPTNVELSAVLPMFCDPAVTLEENK